MNLRDIQLELAERLHRAIGQVYDVPPAGQPELPCAIIGFPTVDSFHSDFAHSITNMTCDIEVMVGRGDVEDALRQLAMLISNDDPGSVISVLEADPNGAESWLRLKCVRTSLPRDEGDGISLLLTIEIDA